MSLAELLPEVQLLARTDRLRLLQVLVTDLAREEDALLEADKAYPVWTPLEAFDGAATLLNALTDPSGKT